MTPWANVGCEPAIARVPKISAHHRPLHDGHERQVHPADGTELGVLTCSYVSIQRSGLAVALPDFLVVGAARAGTTWLDAILRTHPDIFMPENRKEIHYFDRYFDRGLRWYEQYFPDENRDYIVRGETTPRYLYEPNAPQRIHDVLPDAQLIAILRNPVDRAYSHYGIEVRDRAYRGSFEQFIGENPDVLRYGLYSEQLARYLALWPRHRLHILVFEDAVRDRDGAFAELGVFLGVEPQDFTFDLEQRNETFVPRFPRLRAGTRQIGVRLRRRGFDRLVEIAKRIGVGHGFGNRGGLPEMSPLTRSRLLDHYAAEVDRMEVLLGRELASWRR